jgi:adenine-specific DNA-methyltransferase
MSFSTTEPVSRKQLGAFYSPDAYAATLTAWALAGNGRSVLDPSFGGCAFLRVALDQLEAASGSDAATHLFGADIDPDLDEWMSGLTARGVPERNLLRADFLTLRAGKDLPRVDAVVGNPPYVRHHWISADVRRAAASAMREAGVQIAGTASLWAYFVIHAATFLRDGGRMALLLPSSFMQSDYAAVVHNYLRGNFASVWTIRIQERIYPDAQEEAIVLLAADAGAQCVDGRHFELANLTQLQRLISSNGTSGMNIASVSSTHKLELIGKEASQLLHEAVSHPAIVSMGDIAQVRIGLVTGANQFFVMSRAEAEKSGLTQSIRNVVARNDWVSSELYDDAAVELGDRAGLRNRIVIADAGTQEDRALARWVEAGGSAGHPPAFSSAS